MQEVPHTKGDPQKGITEDDVSSSLNSILYWVRMPTPTTDDEVEERINAFFGECAERGELPTLEKLCLSIGISTQTFQSWSQDDASLRRTQLCILSRQILAAFEGELAIKGKVSTQLYSFRSRNFFGMTDSTNLVFERKNLLNGAKNMQELLQKYSENVTIEEEGRKL